MLRVSLFAIIITLYGVSAFINTFAQGNICFNSLHCTKYCQHRLRSSPALNAITYEEYENLMPGKGGCYKRILCEGDDASGSPKPGDKVMVNYHITEESSGLFIASTDGVIFDFKLDCKPSEAIKGWDIAIKSMKKGERSIIICSPEYAYGSAGAPPKIPENATLKCEIELVDWVESVEKNFSGYARPNESRDERMSRWESEIESGTSPLIEDIGIEKDGVKRSYTDLKAKTQIVDIHSPEIRKSAEKQVVCGQGEGYVFLERGKFMELFIPIPEETDKSNIKCKISSNSIALYLLMMNGEEKDLLNGKLYGRVNIDGSYWSITDAAPERYDGKRSNVGFGLKRGGKFVEIYLDKKYPDDTIWGDAFE